ncbi:hypothetical protein BDI4_360072 [Burkholderia diffusa]|nr:hypothetical protein BDI4_360072 [Burkholderia diffusa]
MPPRAGGCDRAGPRRNPQGRHAGSDRSVILTVATFGGDQPAPVSVAPARTIDPAATTMHRGFGRTGCT